MYILVPVTRKPNPRLLNSCRIEVVEGRRPSKSADEVSWGELEKKEWVTEADDSDQSIRVHLQSFVKQDEAGDEQQWDRADKGRNYIKVEPPCSLVKFVDIVKSGVAGEHLSKWIILARDRHKVIRLCHIWVVDTTVDPVVSLLLLEKEVRVQTKEEGHNIQLI